MDDQSSSEHGSSPRDGSPTDGSGLSPVQLWHHYTRYPYLLAKIAFFGAIFFALFWAFQNVANVLFPILVSLLIAYLLDPAIDWFEEKNVSRTVAILIFLGLGLTGVALFILVLYPTVTNQISRIGEQFPKLVDLIQNEMIPWLETTFGYQVPPTFEQAVDKYGTTLKEQLPTLVNKAGNWLAGVATKTGAIAASLINLVMIPIFVFYFLRDFDRMRLAAGDLLPAARREAIVDRIVLADEVVGAWFRGQIQVAGILAVSYAVGLGAIFGFTGIGTMSGIAIGIIAGVLNIIPYFGVMIGVILSALIVLINFSWAAAIGVTLVFVVVQLLEGYVITPKIVGEKVGLSPVVVIIVLLLGGELFGLLGVLLAIPVAGIIRVLLPDLLEAYRKTPFYTGRYPAEEPELGETQEETREPRSAEESPLPATGESTSAGEGEDGEADVTLESDETPPVVSDEGAGEKAPPAEPLVDESSLAAGESGDESEETDGNPEDSH